MAVRHSGWQEECKPASSLVLDLRHVLQDIFGLVLHHFLIEYLSASEKSSCKLAISDLVSQDMKASEIQAKKSKPKLDGIA